MLVLSDEIQKILLLFLRQRNPLLGVVRDDIQAELKGISADNILGVSHLKGRFHNTSDTGDGAVRISLVKQVDDPQLGIGHFDVPNFSLSKELLTQDT